MESHSWTILLPGFLLTIILPYLLPLNSGISSLIGPLILVGGLVWMFKRNFHELSKLEIGEETILFTFVNRNSFIAKRSDMRMALADVTVKKADRHMYLHDDKGQLVAIIRRNAVSNKVWDDIVKRLG